MKKMLLLAGLAFGLCSSFSSNAQLRVNINIGAPVVQQSWYGYDDDYYYMPDQGVYYNVRRGCYVYPEGGNWVYGSALPQRYGGVTWGASRYYRVRERAPFRRDDYYRQQYRVVYNNGYGQHDNGRNNGWDRNGGGNNNGWNNGNGRGGDRGYGHGHGRR